MRISVESVNVPTILNVEPSSIENEATTWLPSTALWGYGFIVPEVKQGAP
jgi:hypothetical protein